MTGAGSGGTPDLAAALQARAGRAAPAFSPDGDTWLTAAQLLARARRYADDLPAGRAVAVPATDPLETVLRLLAAQLAGRTPVVLDPGRPVADVRTLLGAVERAVGAADGRADAGAGPALAVLTSGSSSAPRVVLRTAASWQAGLEPFTDVTGTGPDDVAWAPGGPSSTLTLWALWHSLATGVPVIATGPWRGRRTPPGAATVLHAVPPVLADVLAARAEGVAPALRRAVVAGARLPTRLREDAGRRGVRLVEYYGAAELSFVAVDSDGGGLRAFPGAEVRVVHGRVRVRSPYVSRGYVPGLAGPATPDRPGGSAAPAAGFTVDADGWAGVGDRGTITPDGVLLLAGRGDEAVSVGGHVVLLEDVEAALAGVPGVAELVCTAEPHAALGSRVLAVVVPVAGADPRPALRAAARQSLPPQARPVRYVLAAELPRTAGGKVARGAVAQRWGRQEATTISSRDRGVTGDRSQSP